MFALLDCNNFYVSCELVFRPDLIGKAVVVLSNNDGCIISRSNEAKALGIPMGDPIYKHKKLIDNGTLEYFSANFPLYGDFSQRIVNIISNLCADFEVYSIDEVFIDYSKQKLNENLYNYNYKLKETILKWTGIPVSIGIAPTKTLAKVANKIAKKFPEQTKNVYYIDNETKRIKALKWIDIEDVWGIGKQYTNRLKKIGVNNAYDFTQINDVWIKKNLGIQGLRIKYELNAISCLKLQTIKDKKHISVSRSFEKEITSKNDLKERIAAFAAKAAQKLRKQHSACKNILVFIHSNRFKNENQFYKHIYVELPEYTSSSIEIVKYAQLSIEKVYKEPQPIKKAGIVLGNIIPDIAVNLSLFNIDKVKHEKLMKCVDSINNRFSKEILHQASYKPNLKHLTLQQKLSPCYTTRWTDILKVKV